MVAVVQYVSKKRFNELRKLYPNAQYEYNHEFPETESLIFRFLNKRFAVTIKHEIEGQ